MTHMIKDQTDKIRIICFISGRWAYTIKLDMTQDWALLRSVGHVQGDDITYYFFRAYFGNNSIRGVHQQWKWHNLITIMKIVSYYNLGIYLVISREESFKWLLKVHSLIPAISLACWQFGSKAWCYLRKEKKKNKGHGLHGANDKPSGWVNILFSCFISLVRQTLLKRLQ